MTPLQTNRSQPIAILLATLVALLLGACSPAPRQTTEPSTAMPHTVLVTRHAEKGRFSADPSLSERGVERAEALSLLPITQGVGTIITTQFKRTIETAQPLADRLGVEPRVINAAARPDALAALADEIRISAEQGTVLVVGHSNTVPLIIAALGGPEDIFLTEEDFGDLFILTIDAAGTVTLERTRYGD